jgi:hypothetical protein
MWRLDVRVIEQLARSSEKIEPERAFERTPEQRVHDDGCKRAIGQDLHRVFVEGGHRFDACRRMVHLVKDNPEARKIAHAMPPIENECADQPADESLQQRTFELRQMEQRNARQQIEPEAEPIPSPCMRQGPAGRDAFQHQKGRCNRHHGERGEGEVKHGLNRVQRDSITVTPPPTGCRLALTKATPHAFFARLNSRP